MKIEFSALYFGRAVFALVVLLTFTEVNGQSSSAGESNSIENGPVVAARIQPVKSSSDSLADQFHWNFTRESSPNPDPVKNIESATKSDSLDWSSQDKTVPKSIAYSFPNRHVRFKRYLNDMFGPFSIVGVAFSAGVSQTANEPHEWGRGADGFGKRFASSLGSHFTDQTVNYGLSEAFGQDSGFYLSTRTGFKARAFDAAIQAVTSRTRDGKRVFSVPQIAGDYAGGLVQLSWKPRSYTVGDAFISGTISIITSAGSNLLREFIFK